MLEHFDVLAVAIKVVVSLFHQVVVHDIVIHILRVLLINVFLVLGLLADVVVSRLKVLKPSDVCAIVHVVVVLKSVVLGVLSLLNPLTALRSVCRVSQ